MIKTITVALIMVGALILFFFANQDRQQQVSNRLPWQVTNNADGTTRVLGVDIGKATFKQLMFELQLLAEPALFESPDGKQRLEAYFGKKMFGMRQARLIAELDADEDLLKTMLAESVDKKATPSNNWKHSLSVKNTKKANELRVWRLIYLPVTDYELKQMKFFGEPEEKLKVSETAEYWLYPSKGVALLYDTTGKEIFYYVAPKEYERLKNSLPTKTVMQIQ